MRPQNPLSSPVPLPRLRPLALAVALLSPLAALPLQAAEAPAAGIAVRLDIPAQALGPALIELGRQTRLQISFPPALVEGRRSAAVSGSLPPLQALERLLAGTRIGYRSTGSNTVLLEALPTLARPATPILPAAPADRHLPEVKVVDQRDPFLGGRTIDEELIRSFPAGNGDATSLLKMHPGVQFSETRMQSKRQGEIAPQDISINGAKYYQNLFQVDGARINNDIDPTSNNPNHYANPPSAAQGIALDTSLICKLQIADSNVSARYGGFNGGVVNVDTCDPTAELSGAMSVQYTSSNWTKLIVDEQDYQSFQESSDYTAQPKFRKIFYKGNVSGHLTENWGVTAAFSRRTSDIPLHAYSSNGNTTDASAKTQTRQIDNLWLKNVINISPDTRLRVTVVDAPGEDHYFIKNQKDSGFTLTSGGQQLQAALEHRMSTGKWFVQAGYTTADSSRRSETNYQKSWRPSTDKNWNPSPTATTEVEGSWGNVDQTSEAASLQARFESIALALGPTAHRFMAGAEFEAEEARYSRLNDHYVYLPANAKATTTCALASGGSDSDACSLGAVNYTGFAGKGQYFNKRDVYRTGEIALSTNKFGYFLEDDVSWARLRTRFGLRGDWDDYMDKATLAPRFSLNLDVLGDNRTNVILGQNRYYGRSFFGYRLREGREALKITESRTITAGKITDWAYSAPSSAIVNRFNEIDIPFDDEKMLGLSQRFDGWLAELKFINREGKDQVTLRTLKNSSTNKNYYAYTNDGRNETDITTLLLRSTTPWKLAGTTHQWEFGLDITEIKKSHTDIDTSISLTDMDKYILYNGQLVRYVDRPADNYNRPKTLRLTTLSSIPAWNLTITNFFRLKSGYKAVVNTGTTQTINGESYAVWQSRQYPGTLSWDMNIGWSKKVTGTQSIFANLRIDNVLNRSMQLEPVNNIPQYETGRQFWLELGYRF